MTAEVFAEPPWSALDRWIVDRAGANPDDPIEVEWVLNEALDVLVAYFAAKRGE